MQHRQLCAAGARSFGWGIGRRQCAVEHDRAIGRAGERAPSFLPE